MKAESYRLLHSQFVYDNANAPSTVLSMCGNNRDVGRWLVSCMRDEVEEAEWVDDENVTGAYVHVSGVFRRRYNGVLIWTASSRAEANFIADRAKKMVEEWDDE